MFHRLWESGICSSQLAGEIRIAVGSVEIHREIQIVQIHAAEQNGFAVVLRTLNDNAILA